jgi:hypothetical protein
LSPRLISIFFIDALKDAGRTRPSARGGGLALDRFHKLSEGVMDDNSELTEKRITAVRVKLKTSL